MNNKAIAKAINNRVGKGYARFDSEELMNVLLVTCKTSSDLIDCLVQYEFANDEEDALLAVAA